MNATQTLAITDAEWEVMRVVWAHSEVTSKEVTQILNQKTEWKNTTVKTLLSRLVEKKMLTTKPSGNKFIYYALVEERKSIQVLSEELLNRVCSKKVGSVIEEIISDSVLSFSDIEQIEKVLLEKKKVAVDSVPCNCSVGQCTCHLDR